MFLAVFLAFAAQNTGNNLLYLMSSCFMTCILVAVFLSLRNLAGISAAVSLPDFCFVGEAAVLRCTIAENGSRTRHFIAFEDDFSCSLPAGGNLILTSRFFPEKRGLMKIGRLRVFSFFPADLFITYIDLPPCEIVIGPKPALPPSVVETGSVEGLFEKHLPGKEGDYWMQTLYCDGQDASMINWSISARSNHEWVLLKSVRYGIPGKLFFDLGKISESRFEESLEFITGFILNLKLKNIPAFIWAWDGADGFRWLEVASEISGIIYWLAAANPGSVPSPDVDDFINVDIDQIFGKSNA